MASNCLIVDIITSLISLNTIFILRTAGTTVHVSDPEFAKRILVTNSSNYDRQKLIVKQLPALGTGLLTSNGKEHAIMRKHLNPMFTLGSVKEFIPVFNDKANQLVQVMHIMISFVTYKLLHAVYNVIYSIVELHFILNLPL